MHFIKSGIKFAPVNNGKWFFHIEIFLKFHEFKWKAVYREIGSFFIFYDYE